MKNVTVRIYLYHYFNFSFRFSLYNSGKIFIIKSVTEKIEDEKRMICERSTKTSELAERLRTELLAMDHFGRYLCVGIASVIFFHSVINIGMCIRLTPVTGLPLPLVSYGGTFLVAVLAYLGIVHSIYVHREKQSIMEQL